MFIKQKKDINIGHSVLYSKLRCNNLSFYIKFLHFDSNTCSFNIAVEQKTKNLWGL